MQKKKKREKEIRRGTEPLGGSCERGKVSTHWEVPLLLGTEGELQRLGREHSKRCVEGKVERDLHGGTVLTDTPQTEMLIRSPTGAGGGWVLRLRLWR